LRCFFGQDFLESFFTGTTTVVTLQSVLFHRRPVTCFHLDSHWAACGCADGTVSMWYCGNKKNSSIFEWSPITFLNRRAFVNFDHFVSVPHALYSADLNFLQSPEFVLHTHSSSVSCVRVNAALDIVVSCGSSDGFICIHNVRDGIHLATIPHSARDFNLAKIIINSFTATFAVYSPSQFTLYLYTINGTLIGSKKIEEESTLPEDSCISCMALMHEGNLLVTGGGKRISIRNWLDFTIINQYNNSSNVCDLALDPEERVLFVSLEDGKLAAFYKQMDHNKLRKLISQDIINKSN